MHPQAAYPVTDQPAGTSTARTSTARTSTACGPPASLLAASVVATDLDGTLLSSRGRVSQRTASTLTNAVSGGLCVVVVTGRPPRLLPPELLTFPSHRLVLCANGALVFDRERRVVLRAHALDHRVASEVVDLLSRAFAGIRFATEHEDGFRRQAGYVPGRPGPEEGVWTEPSQLLDRPVVKLLARRGEGDAPGLLEDARALAGHLVEITSSGVAGMLEMSAKGVTKASALQRLASEEGFEAADVVAFGDMPNDIAMLRWSGSAVAVANAHPDVLAVADWVAAGNDEDGVARVVESMQVARARRRLSRHMPEPA